MVCILLRRKLLGLCDEQCSILMRLDLFFEDGYLYLVAQAPAASTPRIAYVKPMVAFGGFLRTSLLSWRSFGAPKGPGGHHRAIWSRFRAMILDASWRLLEAAWGFLSDLELS